MQCLANHCRGQEGQLGDIDWKVDVRKGPHLADTNSDIDGLVADALEVRVNPDDGEDEPQVDGHGLLHREEVQGQLIDLPLQAIDGGFGAKDELADAKVASPVGLDRTLNRLLRHPGHDQELFFEPVKILVELDARHPNLPVM